MASAPNVGAPDSSWRDIMTREDRIKVCQHIMQKLSTYYQMVPEQALREKTSAFESQAYTHAESRTDYLRRIAGGLSNVERQVTQQSVAATASTNNPGGGAGGGGTGGGPGPGAGGGGGATSSAVSRQPGPSQGTQSYTEHMQNQIMLKQQAAAVAKGRSKQALSADSKVANARTRSSSSSVVAEGTSRSKHGPTKTSSQNDLARAGSFNGMNGINQANQISGMPADPSGVTPDMLLAFQQSQSANSQQSRFAMQQATAAAVRQQRGQVNPNAAVAGLAMAGALKQGNPAAIAAARAQQQQNNLNVGNPGNPAANIPGFFPGSDRKLSPEQLNQLVNNMGLPGGAMPPGTQGGVGVSAALSMGSMQRPQQQQNRLTAAMMQQMRMGVSGGAPSNASFDARARQNAAMNPMNVAGGAPAGTEGFPGNAAYNASRMKAPNSSGPTAGPPMVHAADSEEFWEKLEEMKAKYREPLKKMYSFMTIIANSQRPEKKEQFKKHLKDCFQILGLKRGAAVPPTLTTAVLETASKFIDSVINVYKNYIVNEQHALAAQAAHAGKNSNQGGANSQASRVSAPQYAMMQNSQNAAEGGPQAQQQEMFRKLQQQQYQRQQEQAAAAGMGGAMGDNAAKAASAKAVRSMQQNIQLARGMRQNAGMPQQFNQHSMGMGMKKDQRAVMELKLRQQQQQQRMAAIQLGQQMPPTYQRHLAAAAARDPKSNAAAMAAAAAQAGGAQHMGGGANANVGRAMVNNLHIQQMAIHQKRQQAALRQQQQQLENEMNGPGNQSNQGVMAQMQRNQTAAKMAAAAAAAAKGASGNNTRVAEVSLEKRMQNMQNIVENAVKQTLRWKNYVENDAKRSKAERIQNTLAALRNVSGGRSNKRPSSLVDVENCGSSTSTVSGGNNDNKGNDSGRIRSKSVFECSSEQGLRLAKRPKNEASDLKALREAVEADCKAAQKRNGLLEMEITEEFGQPVVACQLLIEEIRVPKLILRVQRGYPRKGGATYSFERPPLGWVGILEEIRERFKKAVQNAPATSVGVAALLDAWAREAETVIENQIRDLDGALSEEEETAGAEIDIKRNIVV